MAQKLFDSPAMRETIRRLKERYWAGREKRI